MGTTIGFRSANCGFEFQPLPTFFNITNTMENRDTPFMQKNLHNQKFSETEGFLYEMFRYCETKKVRQKIVIPPSFTHKIFRYQKYSETQKGPIFSVL